MFSELIAILDTETTGLTSRDRVIELAVMLLDLSTGSVLDARSMLVNPGIPIPAVATEIHGLTDADVCDKPTLADVWPRVLAFVSGAESHGAHGPVGPVDIVAHHAVFDRRLIAQSLHAHGLNEPPWTWRCSKLIAQRVLPDRDTYSLQPLRRELKLDGGTSHRALGDVQTLAALLMHMRGVTGKPWGEWCTG